jgi:hypothetical protein
VCNGVTACGDVKCDIANFTRTSIEFHSFEQLASAGVICHLPPPAARSHSPPPRIPHASPPDTLNSRPPPSSSASSRLRWRASTCCRQCACTQPPLLPQRIACVCVEESPSALCCLPCRQQHTVFVPICQLTLQRCSYDGMRDPRKFGLVLDLAYSTATALTVLFGMCAYYIWGPETASVGTHSSPLSIKNNQNQNHNPQLKPSAPNTCPQGRRHQP